MSYKCVNCEIIKEKDSEVYFVENLNSTLPSPTCSKACAKEFKKKNIKMLKNKINKIRIAPIEKGIW